MKIRRRKTAQFKYHDREKPRFIIEIELVPETRFEEFLLREFAPFSHDRVEGKSEAEAIQKALESEKFYVERFMDLTQGTEVFESWVGTEEVPVS